jgi:lipid II:glycine glycyltransferase (peptidoglycan interpeptide bridge formation enzyme)
MTEINCWDEVISRLPDPHILQSWEWAQVKNEFGWVPIPMIWLEDGGMIRFTGEELVDNRLLGRISAAAMILKRSIQLAGIPAPLSVLYVPKGPLLDWNDSQLRARVLKNLFELARQQRAIFIKIDPDVQMGSGVTGEPGAVENPTGYQIAAELQNSGWRFSEEQVQFRNTVLLDINLDEEQLLARMKQKTRYNLRLAERKGVTVRAGTETDLLRLYNMYVETSIRDGFVIRDQSYYNTLWSTFIRHKIAQPLIAEVDGQPVAALILFTFAARAWYLYGMSTQDFRDRMPNYLLQWQAILAAKQRGCKVYDLWGAPDNFNEDDPLWGVYRFKEGLGGQVVRTIGAWDRPVNGGLYKTYTQLLPRVLNFLRERGRVRASQQMLGA